VTGPVTPASVMSAVSLGMPPTPADTQSTPDAVRFFTRVTARAGAAGSASRAQARERTDTDGRTLPVLSMSGCRQIRVPA